MSGVRFVNWFCGAARKPANRCLAVWRWPTNKSRSKLSRTSTRLSERHSRARLSERALLRIIAKVALMRPSRIWSAIFLFSFLSRRASIPRSVRRSSSASFMLNRTRMPCCSQMLPPLLSEKPSFFVDIYEIDSCGWAVAAVVLAVVVVPRFAFVWLCLFGSCGVGFGGVRLLTAVNDGIWVMSLQSQQLHKQHCSAIQRETEGFHR